MRLKKWSVQVETRLGTFRCTQAKTRIGTLLHKIVGDIKNKLEKEYNTKHGLL